MQITENNPASSDSGKRYRIAFFLLLAVVFLFRLWFVSTLPLSGDEAYHWEWSRHLALGYYDHPGLTAYLIFLCTSLFGGSTELTVRLGALLMLTGTSVICFFLARQVTADRGGSRESAEKAGLIAGALIIITPVYAFLSCYMSTDPVLIFCWSLALYLLYQAFQKEKWRYWIGAGIVFGFAMQSKFLAFFMLGAIGLFVLISPEDRKWLKRPHGYVAFVCALLVFSPFIWWNAKHEWATFMFNFVDRQKQHALSFEHVPISVLAQLLSLSPLLLPLAVHAIYRSIRDWARNRNRMSLFLGLNSLVPLGYFVYLSFRWQVDPHWPAAGWIAAVVYLSCYWAEREWNKETKLVRRMRMAAIGLCLFIAVLMPIVVHISPVWVQKTSRKISWKHSEQIDIEKHSERYGWPELGRWVQDVHDEMLADQGPDGKGVFVVSDQYGLSASIAFYTPDQITTHLWTPLRTKTHGENYRYWDDYPALKGQDAIFVVKKEGRLDRKVPFIEKHFKRTGEQECLPVFEDNIRMRRFFLVRLYDFDGSTPAFRRKNKK
ncbi:ArnT family glycosyltransferase [Verrucomicrobiota bacterium]